MIKIHRNILQIIYLFVLPIISFFLSVVNPKSKVSKFVISTLWGVYGYTRAIISTDDASHWTSVMQSYNNIPISDFFYEIFRPDSSEKLNPLYYGILYSYSLFSDSTAIFWFLWFFISAYIILNIYQNINKKLEQRFCDFFLFFSFLVFIPFSSYGVRFWLAAIFFVYGFFLYNLSQKNIGSFLMVVTPFIHFTFFVLVALFYLSRIIINSKYKGIIIVSLFLLAILIFSILKLKVDNSAFLYKYDYYTDVESRGDYYSQTSWYVFFDKILYNIYSILVFSYLYFHKKIRKSYNEILTFFLLFFFMLLALLSIYDALDRFSRIFSFMILAIIIYIRNKIVINKKILYVGFFVYSYHFLVNILLTRAWVDHSVLFKPILFSLSESLYVNII